MANAIPNAIANAIAKGMANRWLCICICSSFCICISESTPRSRYPGRSQERREVALARRSLLACGAAPRRERLRQPPPSETCLRRRDDLGAGHTAGIGGAWTTVGLA